ncbi:MAG: ferredoxin family protein [Thermoleophilia bacterium]|nr:ferredoxin family protein [Thermoleophilia bacterium]
MSSETLNKVFIDVEIDEPAKSDIKLATELEEVCPVGIFKATEAGTEIQVPALDECVLCNLCIETAPAGSIRIIKLYEQ